MPPKLIPIDQKKTFPKSWRNKALLGICGPNFDDECVRGSSGGFKIICPWHYELFMEGSDDTPPAA